MESKNFPETNSFLKRIREHIAPFRGVCLVYYHTDIQNLITETLERKSGIIELKEIAVRKLKSSVKHRISNEVAKIGKEYVCLYFDSNSDHEWRPFGLMWLIFKKYISSGRSEKEKNFWKDLSTEAKKQLFALPDDDGYMHEYGIENIDRVCK